MLGSFGALDNWFSYSLDTVVDHGSTIPLHQLIVNLCLNQCFLKEWGVRLES